MDKKELAFYQVKSLVDLGLSDYEIARRTGVNRSTVLRWRRRDEPPVDHALPVDWRPADPAAYCYLLGCHLGDGPGASIFDRSR